MKLRSTVPQWLGGPGLGGLANGALDDLEVGYVLVFAIFAVTAWLAFTLAEIGRLWWPLVGSLSLLALLGAALAFWKRARHPVDRPSLLGTGVLVLVGLLGYFPADEWILGGLDPGGYVNAGAAIARYGSIVVPNTTPLGDDQFVLEMMTRLGGSDLPGFYTVVPAMRGVLPTGVEVSATQTVPHGFHLYPVVLSAGYALGGIRAELSVTPILAIFGLVGFYLLARRLFGVWVAAIAGILLAIDPAQVWFARYPDAEILTQVFLFGGLLVLVAALDCPNGWLLGLAGLSLGEVHLTKIEMVVLPAVVLGYAAYQAMVGRADRRWGWFVGIYLALVAQATLHGFFIADLYAYETIERIASPRLLLAGLALTVGAIACGSAVLAVRRLRQAAASLVTDPRWERPLSLVLPIGIVALAGYAYFLRPLGIPAAAVDPTSPAALADINDLDSFVRLGWFLTLPGLLVGVVGWALLTHEARNRRTALVLLVILTDTIIFVGAARITPVYFWAARRWVPLVIPGFCLAAGYAAGLGLKHFRSPSAATALSAAAILTMLASLGRADTPLVGYVEYRGAIQQVGDLAGLFPPASLVLFADGDAGQRLSVPIQYLFQRTSVLVSPNPLIDSEVGQAVRSRLNAGRPVYWVTEPGLPTPAEIGCAGVVVASRVIDLPEKVATTTVPPGADGRYHQQIVVWHITPDRWSGPTALSANR